MADLIDINLYLLAKEQHKDLCNILQGASVTLHIILLGVGGTIYNTHTLKSFKELGLDSQSVKKLASKLHVHSVNYAAKLVHTRRACHAQLLAVTIRVILLVGFSVEVVLPGFVQ